MRRENKFRLYGFAASLGMHFFLLLFLAVNVNFWIKTSAQGMNTKAVQSYLCQLPLTRQSFALSTSPTRGEVKTFTQKFTSPLVGEVARSAGEGLPRQAVDPLLTLLNASIQSHQIYPENALEMEREGRATVAFELSPDGNIQHLQLIKSSGTDSLDEAGLEAVRASSPIPHVSHYLKVSKNFQIDVVFRLHLP